MKPFTYRYQDKLYESEVEYFWDGKGHRYRVSINNVYYVIAICGLRGPTNKMLWVQSLKPGEIEHPHDFIQAIGEGIENTTLLVDS